MSYLDKVSNIHTLDETSSVMNENYSYSDFMRDIVMMECTINETINSHAKESNRIAFELLTEDSSNNALIIKENSENLMDKLKKLWNKISEMFTRAINSIFTKLGNYVNRDKLWIKMNKKKIMNAKLVYNSESSDPNTISVAYDKLACHENLFKKFDDSKLNIEKFIGVQNINNYFKDKFIGAHINISLDDINSSKSLLISNFDSACDKILDTKNEIANIKRSAPTKLTDDELKKYRESTETAVKVCKEKINVLNLYCLQIKNILNKFLDSDEANSSARHAKTNDDITASGPIGPINVRGGNK